MTKLNHLPTEKNLLEAITLAKDGYFKNIVDKRGKFIYSYLPDKDKVRKNYNILRHAGTIYSMLEIYELMPDKDLLKEAERAIKFLLRRVKPVEIDGIRTHVVVERDFNKLGGNGLAIIALAKYITVTNDRQYLPIMKSLAEWMMRTQDQLGKFTIHKQRYSTGELTSFISGFYPGEAILALVRLYEHDQDKKWLDVAEKATEYLIKVRDKNTTIETITPDHWLLYGINDLYRYRPKKYYLKHAFLMCKQIFSRQIKKNWEDPEWVGGYIIKNPPPKSTQAACYSEGLAAVYNIAYDYGHLVMAKQIRKAIARGIVFQLRSQVIPRDTREMRNLLPYIGGFQKSITQTELRIDYTQHNISSIIQYYYILKEKKSYFRIMLNKFIN